jgi:hypothetical protein
MRSFRYAPAGQASKALPEAMAARAIQEQTQLSDEWNAAVPLILMRVYTFLEEPLAVALEAATALAVPTATEPVKLVMVPCLRTGTWWGYPGRPRK